MNSWTKRKSTSSTDKQRRKKYGTRTEYGSCAVFFVGRREQTRTLAWPNQNHSRLGRSTSSLPTLLDFSLLALPLSPFRRGRARRPWPRTSWFGTHKRPHIQPFVPTNKKRRLMPSFLLVGVTRLELATSWSRTKRTTKLCHTPFYRSIISQVRRQCQYLSPKMFFGERCSPKVCQSIFLCMRWVRLETPQIIS